MFIFGKNNNHLIKNNYKNTFSLPQRIKLLSKPIIKCATGFDFIICLTNDLKVNCYYQSALYQIAIKESQNIVDIATQDNLILFVTSKGELFGTDFFPEKLINGELKPKKIKINSSFKGVKSAILKQVKIKNQLIFLKFSNDIILFMRKNDWIQSKSFSDPQILSIAQTQSIIDISNNKTHVFFLSESGHIYKSDIKTNYLQPKKLNIKDKFSKIACNEKQLMGITKAGFIFNIIQRDNKVSLQKVHKISKKFINISISNQNYFLIDQNQQAWVWGINSCGQLGLSDYQPRSTLYPLVSLQKYYIKQILIGYNYTCCLIDTTRQKQSIRLSQRASQNEFFKNLRIKEQINEKITPYIKNQQNRHIKKISNINYTQQDDEQQESSNYLSTHQNIIINKRQNYHKDFNKKSQENKVFFKTSKSKLNQSLKSQKSQNQNGQFKSHNKNIKKLSPYLQRRCNNKSCTSLKKQTQRSSFKNKVSKLNLKQKEHRNSSQIKNKSTSSRALKQSNKNIKKPNHPNNNYSTLKTPTKGQQKQLSTSSKIALKKGPNNQALKRISSQISRQNQQSVLRSYQLKVQNLQDRVYKYELQIKQKSKQNTQLYQLLKQKNLIIQDITSKIILLEQAIEQHQKNLTCRDNQVEQSYLRQKQYQLHIKNLQDQIEKMLVVMNNNQQNKQAELYKKQIQRLSFEIKEKIQGEKQYYRERIKSIERKFQQQKNMYEIQIKNLQASVKSYQKQLLDYHRHPQYLQTNNIEHNPKDKPLEEQNKFNIHFNNQNLLNKNQSRQNIYMESPSFHTLQVKKKVKQEQQIFEQNHSDKGSRVTLKGKDNIVQKGVLAESKKQNYLTELSKSNNCQQKKKSKVLQYFSAYNEPLNQKDETQVDDILTQISKNKYSISKSANKLFNLLQNQNN